MVSMFSSPDSALLELSSNTLFVCRYLGSEALRVVHIKSIHSVVAMAPFQNPGVDHRTLLRVVAEEGLAYESGETFFLAEKLGLETLHLAGRDEAG